MIILLRNSTSGVDAHGSFTCRSVGKFKERHKKTRLHPVADNGERLSHRSPDISPDWISGTRDLHIIHICWVIAAVNFFPGGPHICCPRAEISRMLSIRIQLEGEEMGLKANRNEWQFSDANDCINSIRTLMSLSGSNRLKLRLIHNIISQHLFRPDSKGVRQSSIAERPRTG